MTGRIFGIDFGTKMLKIYQKGEGIIYNQEDVIAIKDNKSILACGDNAAQMAEKAPLNIKISYPVKNGVIADIANMQKMLNYIIKENGKKMRGANYIVAIPTEITEVEKRAYIDLILSSDAKAKHVYTVDKPICDALGVGLDIMNARGVMVVNFGADTTEVSILSLGGTVLSKIITVGGNRLDESIKSAVKKQYSLYIGDKTAENLKKQIGNALPSNLQEEMAVYGRDVVTGLPVEKVISSELIYQAIQEHLHSMIDAVRMILERTPHEISSDIIDSGIYLTGGSSLLKNLEEFISQETELKTNRITEPSYSVVKGIGEVMERSELLELTSSYKQSNYSVKR